MNKALNRDTQKNISCVVCAYNEANRIGEILTAIRTEPAITEIIVVDDGSTDGTAAIIQSFPGVRVITNPINRGKTFALSLGIAAAAGELIMLIDADLKGLTAHAIRALAEPVLSGAAQVSISLRANSLALYRAMGLDFVSGERVLPAWLIKPHVDAMAKLPRWGGEAFMNSLITREGLSIRVVDWPNVWNIRKAQKVGPWRGLLAELSMTLDVFLVLSPVTVVAQNMAMLRLRSTVNEIRLAKITQVWARFKAAPL